MLFPLSKEFSSTSLFQRGGEHHERPKARSYTTEKVDIADRVQELHKLLSEKKPYAHHIELASRSTEQQRQRATAHSRAHSANIADIKKRLDEEAKEERTKLKERLQEMRARQGENVATLKQNMRQKGEEFTTWRKEMLTRVGSKAPVYGGPPKLEDEETREEKRKEERKVMKSMAQAYYSEQRQVKERLDVEAKKNRFRPPEDNSEEIAERRKEQADELKQHLRFWESMLEHTYDAHSRRIADVRKKNEDDYAKHMEHINAAKADSTLRFTRLLDGSRTQLKSIEAKVKSRPPPHKTGNYGGYKPVLKSNRRLREEAAFGGASSFQMTASAPNFSATMADTQRTLTPRAAAELSRTT